MPGYRGHLCGSFVVYVFIMIIFVTIKPSLMTACEWLLATCAGALFPDIDVKSKGQKYFYYFVLLLFLCLLYQGKFHAISCVSFMAITPMLSRHRGIFHKPWFLVCMPISVWGFMSLLFPALMRPLLLDTLFFITGALSHVCLDFILSNIVRYMYR